MRLRLALFAAKFAAVMLKAFGRLLHFNGTYFPGKVALKSPRCTSRASESRASPLAVETAKRARTNMNDNLFILKRESVFILSSASS